MVEDNTFLFDSIDPRRQAPAQNGGVSFQEFRSSLLAEIRDSIKGSAPLKCLSIRQPWAWWIVNGHKCVENRTWSTSYRGLLLIHAGKTIDKSAYAWAAENGIDVPDDEQLVRGAIIGSAWLVGCQDLASDPAVLEKHAPWAFGPRCWLLEQPRVLDEPVAYKGRLGLFDVGADYTTEKRRSQSDV